MEDESFVDVEVAEILNRNFVAVKVDREERPDIDAVYMNVTQRMTGGGGWPMTVIMTPEQKPFFAGTYIPKKPRYGSIGLVELLNVVVDKWGKNKEELVRSSNRITDAVIAGEGNKKSGIKLSKKVLREARDTLISNFDRKYGGFGRSPKFPQPSSLLFLLNYYCAEDDEEALRAVEKTLESMFRGGIFDHVGGGFSRYSTDEKWLAPHFEKMLYDNALLLYTYIYAFQITKRELYKNIAEKIFCYILREMTDEEGGFYSAQDADSEGEEGKYYVFTPGEIVNVLGKEDGEYFIQYYGLTERGNFEGKNIPNLIDNYDYYRRDERIEEINKRLYEYRLKRTVLHKDDKILTSWNGMMIAALAKAYQVTRDEKYLKAAEKAVDFIEKHLTDGDLMKVMYREGSSMGVGTLDDYAMYVWGLTEMYEADFNVNYLKRALELNEKMIELFKDDAGGFFMKSKAGEQLIYNPKETYDGATPSGNSVAALNLFRLARITGKVDIEDSAAMHMQYLSNNMSDYPSGYTFALLPVFFEIFQSKEIVCLADNDDDLKKLKSILTGNIMINNTVVAVKYTALKELKCTIGYIGDYKLIDGKTTFYVCRNKNCSLPFTDFNKLEEEISM